MNTGSGHNLDLSLGISNGSKGKDTGFDFPFHCKKEGLVVRSLYSQLTPFYISFSLIYLMDLS